MIEISFSPQKYDFIVIPGLIYKNKKQQIVDFLIDTAASTTMIDPKIMEDIGYSKNCSEYISPATVSGPSGKEEGYRVKGQKILLYSMECILENIDIVCIRPERNVEALLGVNFLKYFHYCIDHKNHKLTLKKQLQQK